MIYFAILSVFSIFVMLFLAKYSSIDRGVDKKNTTQSIIIGSEPYVPPEVDVKIKKEMDRLQQVVFPIQYVDNGILNAIPTKTKEISEVLKGQDYSGPEPYSNDSGTSLEHLRMMIPLNIKTSVLPTFYNDDEIIPYNSVNNIVSSSQKIEEFESESV